jgi:hypothetical protein
MIIMNYKDFVHCVYTIQDNIRTLNELQSNPLICNEYIPRVLFNQNSGSIPVF